MDTRKDIGQFFNDNLNQMDFTPNEDGWNKIENELKEKKRKKRIFFWLFFASFLSGCLITLLLGYSTNLFENTSTIDNNQNNSTIGGNSKEIKTIGNSNINSKENNLANGKNENNELNEKIVTNNKKAKYSNNNKNSVISNENGFEKNNITNKSKQNKNYRNNKSYSKNYDKYNLNYSSNQKNSKANRKNNSVSRKKANRNFDSSNDNSFAVTTNSKKSQNSSLTDGKNFGKNSENGNQIAIDTNNIVANSATINDTITLSNVIVKPKKIEKKLEKDSTEVITKKETNSFIIAPYYGVGFMNKNQVTGNFTTSKKFNLTNEHYGIMVRWMRSKKYGLQIGLGYTNASTKTEIEKTNSNELVFNDVENNSSATFPSSNKLTMTHNFSMYEIPLEFYYKFRDEKIGLAFASGISHTIIKNNDIYITSAEAEKTRIGDLQTVLKQNLNINFKIYGSYKFNKKLEFELYPSFQYQFLNTLKNKDLNPFILSLRAGLSYKF